MRQGRRKVAAPYFNEAMRSVDYRGVAVCSRIGILGIGSRRTRNLTAQLAVVKAPMTPENKKASARASDEHTVI